jgi:hypothetical protein
MKLIFRPLMPAEDAIIQILPRSSRQFIGQDGLSRLTRWAGSKVSISAGCGQKRPSRPAGISATHQLHARPSDLFIVGAGKNSPESEPPAEPSTRTSRPPPQGRTTTRARPHQRVVRCLLRRPIPRALIITAAPTRAKSLVRKLQRPPANSRRRCPAHGRGSRWRRTSRRRPRR